MVVEKKLKVVEEVRWTLGRSMEGAREKVVQEKRRSWEIGRAVWVVSRREEEEQSDGSTRIPVFDLESETQAKVSRRRVSSSSLREEEDESSARRGGSAERKGSGRGKLTGEEEGGSFLLLDDEGPAEDEELARSSLERPIADDVLEACEDPAYEGK